MQIEERAPSWAECVFHVLAHVDRSGLPSSLFSPWYVRFVEASLGPASGRPLGADAAALSACLADHASLAFVQGLAWLWRDSADAWTYGTCALGELQAHQVADAELLASLSTQAQAVELLRCAALLEADGCARLPPSRPDTQAFEGLLSALIPHAPALAHAEVTFVRPLTAHGRVRGKAIWVGVPGEGVTPEHAALQAAHEATVREVRLEAPALPERSVEAVALVLLHERIAGSPFAAPHRRWCAQWGVRDDHLARRRLSPEQCAVLERCLEGGA